jgi:hypothetical protein
MNEWPTNKREIGENEWKLGVGTKRMMDKELDELGMNGN